ncbi:MAG: prenyltransferase/squalene oxidase repeat-containing protein, partial [Planctomycetota bacterium]
DRFKLKEPESRGETQPQPEFANDTERPKREDTSLDDAAWETVNKIAKSDSTSSEKPMLARPIEQVPQRYQARMAENKSEVVRRRGGSDNTEAAVSDALRWLAKHQHESGRWDASDHGAGKGQLIDGRFRGTAGMKADTGITGLALLALLGDGNTHQHGKYKREVAKGLEFLMRQQRADGNLCGEATNYSRMYCHGIASLALAEAFAMSGDSRLKPFVDKAVSYSLSCQNPATGGWRYNPGDAGDTSQLGWQLMFLTSAEQGGVRIPDYVKVGMRRFLQSVSVGANNGLASYRSGQGVTPSMTAEALVCRIFLGASNPRLESEAAEFIGRELPGYGRPNLYYWYYATLALSQTDSAVWEHWNSALKHQLLMTQQQRGDNRGSWTAETVWGGHGGRVYSTALAAMCLEVYYRYPLRNREVANRP